MNKKINLTAIDTQITPIIHAVQFDTDRYLDCYFEDIDITGVSSARIYAKKPDDTEVYNDCVIQNGYITAPLTSQTLAVVGKVNCQLQLVIDGTLTSFAFTVIVDESLVSSSAIPSSNEYTALESLIAEAESVIDGLPTKVSKSGDSMSGTLDMTDNKIVNLGTPNADADAATKEYVDDAVSAIPVITVDSALSDTSENPVQNKVVKSAIDSKEDVANKVTVITGDEPNPDEIYPSVSAVIGMVNDVIGPEFDNKEDVANKVTSLSASSTDTEYPSAKAVYDGLDSKFDKTGGTINGAVSLVGNLNINNRQINNLAAPAYPNSATNRQFVEDAIAAALIVDTEEVIP